MESSNKKFDAESIEHAIETYIYSTIDITAYHEEEDGRKIPIDSLPSPQLISYNYCSKSGAINFKVDVKTNTHNKAAKNTFTLDKRALWGFLSSNKKGLAILVDSKNNILLRSDSPYFTPCTKHTPPPYNLLNESTIAIPYSMEKIKSTNWSVIYTEPKSSVVGFLNRAKIKISLLMLMPMVIVLISLWFLSKSIAAPLHLLAEEVESEDLEGSYNNIENIQTWYYEARKIKLALLSRLDLAKRKIDNLRKKTMTDPLTGLFNRRVADDVLMQLFKDTIGFSIISIDVDNFKTVNDKFGHDIGDEVLRKISNTVKSILSENNYICRMGGEEFIIIMPLTPLHEASYFAENIRAAVEFLTFNEIGVITVSIGVASRSEKDESHEVILKRADSAMYKAKKSGKNKVLCQ